MNKPASALRAFRNRNFRRFYFGQGISLTGTWMQSVAMSWLIFRLTGSPFMLGLVGFSAQIPAFLLSPLAGVLSDRWSRHRILIMTQILSMIQALLLAAITISGRIQVWQIITLSLMLGVISAFDLSARQAFIVQLIDDKNDLVNAIALNSALFNATRLIGPTVAGILVALADEGVCFLINGLSYGAVIAALVSLKIKPRHEKPAKKKISSELIEGLKYTLRVTPIRDLLILLALISLVGMSFPVLMPVFAKTILKGGSHTFGFLSSASGFGALLATISLATRKKVPGLEKLIAVSLFIFGLGLIAFSYSDSLVLSMFMLVIVGFGMISSIASINTILQTIVEESKRGRVMSFYIMSFMGAAPLGSFMAGSVSTFIGVQHTVCMAGMLAIAGGLLFLYRLPSLHTVIRPIYRKIGILPEIAEGIQAADDLRKPPEY